MTWYGTRWYVVQDTKNLHYIYVHLASTVLYFLHEQVQYFVYLLHEEDVDDALSLGAGESSFPETGNAIKTMNRAKQKGTR